MAIVKINFFSESLVRNVNIIGILPIDKRSIDGEELRSPDRPMKALYLLHGVHGCEYDWIVKTRVERWAMQRNLAVFLVAGENAFYNDAVPSHNLYAQFMGKDLIQFTRSMFRLSDKREDTFVAGLSMGGLGSIYTGLRNPETFGYIGSFSGAFVAEGYPKDNSGRDVIGMRSYFETVFGKEEDFKGSAADYYALAEKTSQNKELMPQIYMACGTEDGLITVNRNFSTYLKELGYDAISYTGWQVPIITDEIYGNANIIDINTEKILNE
ncbi:MAG: alpha/beta hydrolase-fold protein, partial [Lachnospiraceae bacterium]|nr:alpha/beta hydrolase-fold protein [Lachnospiraceae bacterium]